MPDLSAIARERAALATVADTIIAASVGKGLRVTVACPNSHLAVIDRLAQALHARGRACRCLPPKPNPVGASDPPPDRQESNSTVVVITSGSAKETDRGVQRVNITVAAAVPTPRDGDVSHQKAGEPPTAVGVPDIILAYHDPDGPLIRYMAPHLSTGDRR
ncbi:hypothetical protein V6U81_19320 [Micromonospora sp. CPCC 205711]|uniref:hypothetical protein n=1 Tax=Micromonospora sp. CPCC 205547 TaxID=3122400 RepID=UPI002FEE83AA